MKFKLSIDRFMSFIIDSDKDFTALSPIKLEDISISRLVRLTNSLKDCDNDKQPLDPISLLWDRFIERLERLTNLDNDPDRDV